MKKLVIAVAALALSAGTAVAQDTAFDWSGFYVGAQAGYGWGTHDIHFPTNGALDASRDPDGFLGGVYAGYNFQRDNLVFGAEADIAYAHLRDNGPILHNGVPNPAEDWHSTVDWSGAVRARVGYAMDRTLIYVSGGAVFAHFSTAIYETTGLRGEVSETKTGWTVGTGIEHAFTDNLVGRLDYRYADFGSTHYPLNGIPGTIPTDVSLKTHDLRIGIAYKF